MSFEKWWNDSSHNFSKDFPSDRWLAKECYKAGMLRAVEIVDYGWRKGIGDKFQGDVFVRAIRKEVEND